MENSGSTPAFTVETFETFEEEVLLDKKESTNISLKNVGMSVKSWEPGT